MTEFCSQTDLSEYLLAAYTDKIEEINPGTLGRHIAQASGEITEALLQGGFAVPDENTSATLKRICAVFTCWRSVGDITSLMDTEASSANEWLPLQTLYKQCVKELEQIRAGRLDPFPSADDDPDISKNEMLASSPARIFTDEEWDGF